MISIILPTHRRPSQLLSCLQRLEPLVFKGIVNVVVIMDGSDGRTKSFVDKFSHSGFHYIHGDGSLFWGGAISLGMDLAFNKLSSRRVIWLNDDTEFSTADVEQFIEQIQPQHHIVAARLYAKNVNRNIYNVSIAEGIIPVKYVNGNFTSISVDVFRKIGNIDSHKYPHFADAPYIERAIKSGFSVYCNTNVTVYIVYDVLRHLPIWMQVVLCERKLEFFRWMLFDIRSKWFLSYRLNYYHNKYSIPVSFVFFVLAFVRDWLPAIAVLPISLFLGSLCKKFILQNLLPNRISNAEISELVKEVKFK